jgi:hypothetical protein
MSPGAGSSCDAFFCATRRICLSSFITSSRARTDFSRPTKSGTIMCGKTRKDHDVAQREDGIRDASVEFSHHSPTQVDDRDYPATV